MPIDSFTLRQPLITKAITGQTLGLVINLLLVNSTGTLFIKAIGGSDAQALIFGGMMAFTRWVRIPCAVFVPDVNGKRFMLWSYFLACVALTLAILTPFTGWSANTTTWTVVIGFTLSLLLFEAGKTFWWPILYRVVPDQRRGRFFALLRISWSLFSLLFTMVAGYFIGNSQDPQRYQVVLLIATGLCLLRNQLFFHLPTPSGGKTVKAQEWKKGFVGFFRNKRTLYFFSILYLFSFSQSMFYQPITLYMDQLGIPRGNNIIINSVFMIGTVTVLAGLGKRIDRVGTRKVYFAGHISLALFSFATIFSDSVTMGWRHWWFGCLILGVGMIKSAVDLAMTVDVFRLSPERGRTFFIAMATIIYGMNASLGPLMAGGLLKIYPQWTSQRVVGALGFYPMCFALATALSLLAALLHLHFFKKWQTFDQ